jgi:hypothetical protein
MTREALYVLASRARERTTLYVATRDQDVDGGDDDAHVTRSATILAGTRRAKSC